MKNDSFAIDPELKKTKLKEIPGEELKALFEKIKEVYGKAKIIAEENKLDLPEEDFLSYVPGLGLTASHSGSEKQIGQHVLLCVYIK